jgi:UDP-N-acetylmuramyl pentapeptide phosphotransferase/UDP-N-acetylglucosamine-1-phosphate transferase
MLIEILFFSVLWVLIEMIYFRIADKYNIIDKPNARSSHSSITIRGGGIIFPIAALVTWPYSGIDQILLAISVVVMATLSFIDDIRTLRSEVRLFLQLIAMFAVAYSFSSQLPWLYLLLVIFILIGVTNAYNFMDGINGITAFYSLVAVGTLFWIHNYMVPLFSERFFIALLTSLLVFSWFNCRKKAKTFAGDVGSVAIAMILCILLLYLILETRYIHWVCMLGIYGIDVIATIICRIFRREPLLQAHRSHFYQYLANDRKWNHIAISLLYALCQLMLNISIIYSYQTAFAWLPWLILLLFLILYIIFRLTFEGPRRLFYQY